ncbi:hypothetical protein F511_34087 [Dorcoceras hygrometricum]|uniref:Uncharacterized protein n=1 Tax=Dorcoceras hygrometricum TaxID=472368 RepID=A0A2Z7BJT1_9LAMI|nr:hypothetical protein F511_34087 [Dorcoceras hygrometricum]
MRAIKDRIARPASRLEIITIEPLYHAQQVSRWKSSFRDLQDPSAHHSSVVFRHDKSVGHHSDDSVGLFRHDNLRSEPCYSSTSLPKLETTRNAHPETQTSRRTNELLCTKTQQLHTSSPTLIQGFKWVAIERATHKEPNATKITQIIGGERRKSEEDMFGWSPSRNAFLITNLSRLVPVATLKTERFDLLKRRRSTSATGSSNHQLVAPLLTHLLLIHLCAPAGSVAPADPSEPTFIFTHETSATPSGTIQRAQLFDDLSCFSAKFLHLGLRNRVLLFSALVLLRIQYTDICFWKFGAQSPTSPLLPSSGRFHKKKSHRASIQVNSKLQQVHTSRNCVSN